MNNAKIERLYRVIDFNLSRVDGSFSNNYRRMVEAVASLANLIMASKTDESTWWIEGNYSLGDFIVGAYWHFTEYHEGQNSLTYRALCFLDEIFSPGCSSGPEKDSGEFDVYDLLNNLADYEASINAYIERHEANDYE